MHAACDRQSRQVAALQHHLHKLVVTLFVLTRLLSTFSDRFGGTGTLTLVLIPLAAFVF